MLKGMHRSRSTILLQSAHIILLLQILFPNFTGRVYCDLVSHCAIRIANIIKPLLILSCQSYCSFRCLNQSVLWRGYSTIKGRLNTSSILSLTCDFSTSTCSKISHAMRPFIIRNCHVYCRKFIICTLNRNSQVDNILNMHLETIFELNCRVH